MLWTMLVPSNDRGKEEMNVVSGHRVAVAVPELILTE